MTTVVVTFEVDDEHIGDDLPSWARRLDGELQKAQRNSEVGLVVTDATINDFHLYSFPPNRKGS